MKDPKLFVFSLLLFAASLDLRAQNSVADCEDIKVEVKALQPTDNQPNGRIDLVFSKPTNNYKIFLLNAGSDKTGKEEIEDGKLSNLKAGFFDFLIMDKNKKGCIRQLTVVLK